MDAKCFAQFGPRRFDLYRLWIVSAWARVRMLAWKSKLAIALGFVAISCAVSLGQIGDSELNEDLFARENVRYRQQVAASSLDEDALMLKIVSELGTGLSKDDRARVARILVSQGRKHKTDPLLLVAVIVTESSFGPREVSSMGARGLMQVKPSVAEAIAQRHGLRWRHADQLFDPAYNVRLGTRYLFELVLQFGDVKNALIAYNYGETALRCRIATGQALPTAYLRRVKKNYYTLRDRFGDQAPWEPVQFELPIQ